MGVNLGRFLAERCSTPICWRSARFSNSRAGRERKIEDKVAKRVAKEISIGGENYDSSIIPVRSDISRFSRGTLNPSDASTIFNLGCVLFHLGRLEEAKGSLLAAEKAGHPRARDLLNDIQKGSAEAGE